METLGLLQDDRGGGTQASLSWVKATGGTVAGGGGCSLNKVPLKALEPHRQKLLDSRPLAGLRGKLTRLGVLQVLAALPLDG